MAVHELAVCQALIRQVEDLAEQNQAVSVLRVYVQIGPLSGVEPDLLRDAYPIACAGSVAEGSELDIERMAIRVLCDTCGAETDALMNRLVCGACGDWHTQIISGDEMLLTSVELEKPVAGAQEESDVMDAETLPDLSQATLH